MLGKVSVCLAPVPQLVRAATRCLAIARAKSYQKRERRWLFAPARILYGDSMGRDLDYPSRDPTQPAGAAPPPPAP